MTPDIDIEGALMALDWQVHLGATEAIGDVPLNRYEEVQPLTAAKPAVKDAAPVKDVPSDAPADHSQNEAENLARGAQDLAALQALMAGFQHCELKKGARNLVFADGDPSARVMIIGEAPSREEDMAGAPFVGRAGELLDNMLAAIDMSRKANDEKMPIYLTCVIPWRPPQDREPTPDEIAMMRPFLLRHVELVDPDVVVLMGNAPCEALLGKRGISRLRGVWGEAPGVKILPMSHPAQLLKTPAAKREAWADLQALRAHLKDN